MQAGAGDRLRTWTSVVRGPQQAQRRAGRRDTAVSAEVRTLPTRLLGGKRAPFEGIQDDQGKRYVFTGEAALSGFFEGTVNQTPIRLVGGIRAD